MEKWLKVVAAALSYLHYYNAERARLKNIIKEPDALDAEPMKG